MSLRKPQRESLERLGKITEILNLKKDISLDEALILVNREFPTVTNFEREFPSLCFALATGVGKTRLMGAFIAYLYLAHGKKNFFVLAPNRTIYTKLITDFTPNTSKYVFKGIGELSAGRIEIITGDTFEKRSLLAAAYDIHINVFNIDKINKESRAGSSPKIKSFSEYIGQSYFEYLSELEDLVLLMDESHRYRATAGEKAINELKPILGLELTATPYIQDGKDPRTFANVLYDYPLAKALADGYVKEIAAVTQRDFRAAELKPEQIEKIKLEDGVALHEHIKVELETYARSQSTNIVKPFVLVIARDTDHARTLLQLIESDEFFDGRYKGKAIQVDSSQRGEEKDEVVERLLKVEDPSEPTEIVIHVNMLKEGWDVTNLYTIVPLRAANARILIEQSIGRGLRLPYGRRTGVKAVDTLNIIAHDKFHEIIEEAKRGDSPIRITELVLGENISLERRVVVIAKPNAIPTLILENKIQHEEAKGETSSQPTFKTEKEVEIATSAYNAINKRFRSLPNSQSLKSPEIIAQLISHVELNTRPQQQTIDGTIEVPDVKKIVELAVEYFQKNTIDIPRIALVPKGDVSVGFSDFDLDTTNIRVTSVSRDLIQQNIRTDERSILKFDTDIQDAQNPEDYIVSALIDFDDISYDEHSELLYKLANQCVAQIRSYTLQQNEVKNTVRSHSRVLAESIHSQMVEHQWDKTTGYDVSVSEGFIELKELPFTRFLEDKPQFFRDLVDDKKFIRGIIFSGYKKCIYEFQKFDSDTERKFAVILEDDEDVVKWFKPAKEQFQIYWTRDRRYEPDFVVETTGARLLCETKRSDEIDTPDVLAKAKAAKEWCDHASQHAIKFGGKPWKYVLIPHYAASSQMTVKGLLTSYGQ